MRAASFVVLAAVAAMCSGCLRKDSTVTWYVEPGGQVTWSILEKDVRSDAQAPTDRESEEAQYLSDVRSNQHPAARGLTRLGASGLKVTLLRDRAPFTVLTEGELSGLDELGRRLIIRFGLSGQSAVTRDGDTWTWTLLVNDPHSSTSDESAEGELIALMGDRVHVALRRGRFISATGFNLDDERRIATLVEKDDKSSPEAADDEIFKATLTWEVR